MGLRELRPAAAVGPWRPSPWSIVAQHSAQFRGNTQHDALEFLLWLLDRLHEDLGSSSPVPKPRGDEQVGGPCGACAESSLTCPHCRKQSNTFDPFLCVSLPIPPRQTRPLNVNLVFQCKSLRFGPPLVMREDRGVSWEQLQQCILAKMRYLMRSEVPPQGAGALFRIRVAGSSVGCSYLATPDNRPLHCHPCRALQLGGPGGPPHVKLTVEWDISTKERLFGSIQEEVVQDAESVRLQQQAHQQQHSCTLDECFQLYTKEEQLAPDDAWRCPHCKVLQQGTVKLSLWTLPDILIIHLKRFRQVAERRHKLTTLVRFPLRGLDMAPHVAQRGQAPGKQVLGHWAPWKAPLYLPESCQLDYLYDLYAVCNHHGSMQGGHYTASCCNSLDGRWYSYDDSTVEGVQEDEVSTRSAYILFYQRRNAIPSWSASSSMRGSTSSSLSDHWVSRLSTQRESTGSRGFATCPSLPRTPSSPSFPDAGSRLEKGYWERLFQSLQRYYHGEAITGLLLLYPSCMVHALEPLQRRSAAPSTLCRPPVLFSVLRALRDAGQQGHRPLVMEPKIVVLSHNIPTRLFHQWSYQAPNVSMGPVAAGAEPLEGLVGECLATLLRLGQLQQHPESPPHGLDALVEQVPELLGLEAAAGHLLVCAELQSPEQFLQAYDSPLHPSLGADHVWPVWEHLALPSAALQQTWPMGTLELPDGRKDSRALQHGGFAAGPGIGS
ncbi:PREDICTED: ubiquitin carboxyl-terminal hydrolase 43 [Tinamus guttatus]|nr:PREDICTED: ubiquitin carboxyl-terminal hydrolase 43 [Tinamus guttatus]